MTYCVDFPYSFLLPGARIENRVLLNNMCTPYAFSRSRRLYEKRGKQHRYSRWEPFGWLTHPVPILQIQSRPEINLHHDILTLHAAMQYVANREEIC